MELSAAAAAQAPASAATLESLTASLTQIAGLFRAGMLTEAEFSAAKSAALGLAGLAIPQTAAAEAPMLLGIAPQTMSCSPQVKSESVELLLAGLSRNQLRHQQSAVPAAEASALLTRRG